MSKNQYDLVVLGGGPGGYVAAIRAAQKFGGTCLRVGCIPSKALLESSHMLIEARDHMMEHGISATKLTVDLSTMMRRKASVVDTLTGGISQLLKKNKVTAIVGRGKLTGPNEIEIAGGETVTAKNIIIATGSVPMALPGIELDGDRVGDSTAALSYTSVPRRLVVIGGGYIGLELGSVWSRLGSEVIILEAMDKVLGGLDQEIARSAQRTFEKQGLEFRTGMWVESVVRNGDKCTVKVKSGETIECDRVLVSAGRSPNTQSIGLDKAGVEVDSRGFIVTDDHLRTKAPSVYAIGDCVGGAMLAHKASEEGIAVVERIVNGLGHVNYDTIPAIVYTHPEIASVGKTEEQLKSEGVNYKKGSCPFGANGRARAMGAGDGKIKILADAETDRILGVHAIGSRAGDLIAEAAIAMNFGASSEDLARCCHAHPTLSEIMQEAALAVSKRAIHT